MRGSIFAVSRIEECRQQISIDVVGHPVGVGDHAVTNAEGTLGCFDKPVDMLEAVRLRDMHPVEQRQNHQRCQTLCRRRRIVERTRLGWDAERLIDGCSTVFKIGARHRAADAFEIACNFPTDIAAIKIVEAGMREMIEGLAKFCLPE